VQLHPISLYPISLYPIPLLPSPDGPKSRERNRPIHLQNAKSQSIDIKDADKVCKDINIDGMLDARRMRPSLGLGSLHGLLRC
jgi:hypothetical protein